MQPGCWRISRTSVSYSKRHSSEITRLEVHGPESELDKLREPLAALNPQFFTLEYGFRR